MPADNDFIRSTIVTEEKGVTFRNDIYWQIVETGTVTNLNEVASIISAEWFAVSSPVLVNDVAYVAVLVDNLTINELRGVVIPGTTGGGTGDSHPQDQVLRFNEYGQNLATDKIRVGGFNLSGIREALSTTGRLNSTTIMNPISLFLGTQHLDVSSGLKLNPQVRTRVPASSPPVYVFHRTLRAVVNPRFSKLKSRKTSILVA